MSLLNKLQAAGIKVYGSTPLWEAGNVIIAKLPIGDNAVVIKSKFDTNQLVIEEDGKRVYIPLKTGVMPDKKEYKLQEFSASRDWEEYHISAGDTKIFAV